MAANPVAFIGDGKKTVFPNPLQELPGSVTVNGVSVAFSWTDGNTLTIVPAPAIGASVVITPTTDEVAAQGVEIARDEFVPDHRWTTGNVLQFRRPSGEWGDAQVISSSGVPGSGVIPYKHGTAAGPMAYQDGSGQWWEIDLSGGVVDVTWFGADSTGANDCSPQVQAAATALAASQSSADRGFVLYFPPGEFVFSSRVVISLPGSNNNGRYNGAIVRGAGQMATKWIAGASNADGIFWFQWHDNMHVCMVERGTFISRLDCRDAATRGKNNGVSVRFTNLSAPSYPTPLASWYPNQTAAVVDVNWQGDDPSAGTAVIYQGLWAKLIQFDYVWLPVVRFINVQVPGDLAQPGLDATSLAAGTATTAIEMNQCYLPEMHRVLVDGFFYKGAHYHGTLVNLTDTGRSEGGLFSECELAGQVDGIVCDQSYASTLTGDITLGSNHITNYSSAAGLFANSIVAGPGIPDGAIVTWIDPAYIALSMPDGVTPANATATNLAATITNVSEPAIFSDDIRIIGGQFNALRHNVVLDRWQGVSIIGNNFLVPAAQYGTDKLPASVFCKSSSDIIIANNAFMGGGFALNLTPGGYNASTGVRVEGCSTYVQLHGNKWNMGGIGLYANPSSAIFTTASGVKQSIFVDNSSWSGRSLSGSWALFLPVADPQGVVSETVQSQDANGAFHDHISRTGSAGPSPHLRLRRLRNDYATNFTGINLSDVEFNALNSSGVEKTFATVLAIMADGTSGSERADINIQAMVSGVLTTLLQISGYGNTVLAPRLRLSDALFLDGLAAGPSYASDAAAATGGVAIGRVYRNGSQLMLRVS